MKKNVDGQGVQIIQDFLFFFMEQLNENSQSEKIVKLVYQDKIYKDSPRFHIEEIIKI